MLGWHISVYRQPGGGEQPATAESEQGTRLAVWQASFNGLQWLDELVKAGKAINLGGNGYPCRYTLQAANLVPKIIDEPPEANQTWVHGEGDVLTEKWQGRTVVDKAVGAQCLPQEWLLVVAWDES